MSAFQTIFYHKATGKIVHIEQNKYIKSKQEKLRYCPDYTHDEVNFLYFPSNLPINPETHRVRQKSSTHPPVITEPNGIPLVYTDRRQKFIETRARYKNIIIDMADSMGDNLFRAAAILEAQKTYPDLVIFCKVLPEYKEIISLIPGITIFTNHNDLNITPQECGTISLNGGILSDPRGENYSKASLYGLFLNLPEVPGTAKITLPTDFDKQHAEFAQTIGLRADGHNIVVQIRTKNWEGKSWDNTKAAELARLIRQVYDCKIFYVGAPLDMTGTLPGIENLTGKTTWLQTAYLLTKASNIICIDSGVLHLCRSLNIPYICLWGETHPRQILGEEPGPQDIVLTKTMTQSDIKAITPLKVFNTLFPEHQKEEQITYDPAKNYSQHGDQEVIFNYLQEHPPTNKILVDVGAFGRDMSNTFALLELGWRGLLIEANPERVKIIEKEFAGLDVEILNMAISDEEGEMPLHLHSELGHDSLDPKWYPQDKTNESIMIKTSPLEKVLKTKKIPRKFDLLSVDTEGWDERIMTHLLNESTYRPTIIVTECTSYKNASALFEPHGYRLLAQTGNPEYGNLIFAKDT